MHDNGVHEVEKEKLVFALKAEEKIKKKKAKKRREKKQKNTHTRTFELI